MKNTIKFLIIFTLLLTTACNDTNQPASNNSDETSENLRNVTLDNSDWLLYTPDFEAGLRFDGNEGVLSFIGNTEEALGTPSLYTTDSETGDRLDITMDDLDLTEEEERSVTFPGENAPGENDYIGMEIDGEEVGGFHSKSLPMLSPFAPFPDNPQTVRPTSGIWDFTMTITTAGLSGAKCPQGMRTMTTTGQGNLNVTPDGLNAEMIMDGQNVDFYRVAITDTQYESFEMPFPAFDENGNGVTGLASYKFTALDQESIEGELFWDNTVGCTGTYPFGMELVLATEIPPYVPAQGMWDLSISPFICGNTPVDPVTLSNIPWGPGMLSVSGGGPVPMTLSMSTAHSPLTLMQTADSNFYTSLVPNMLFGTVMSPPIPPLPPMPVTLSGTFQGWAQSENSIIGVVTGFGTNGCTFTAPFTMSQ
ncbi:hypothetical protein HN709_00180 [Candidatus Peregrinibacteria bacterium]|jgi:hypothetical protein|nr:hypothetical protein [Candidatus Peregrinibacteria bacterium]MBT7736089.1 hypothetical protein [Candidatus Peregrinibacteria bacterium]